MRVLANRAVSILNTLVVLSLCPSGGPQMGRSCKYETVGMAT